MQTSLRTYYFDLASMGEDGRPTQLGSLLIFRVETDLRPDLHARRTTLTVRDYEMHTIRPQLDDTAFGGACQ